MKLVEMLVWLMPYFACLSQFIIQILMPPWNCWSQVYFVDDVHRFGVLSGPLCIHFIPREKLLTGTRELRYRTTLGGSKDRWSVLRAGECTCRWRYLVKYVVMLVISDWCVLVLQWLWRHTIHLYSCLRKIPSWFGSELASCIFCLKLSRSFLVCKSPSQFWPELIYKVRFRLL